MSRLFNLKIIFYGCAIIASALLAIDSGTEVPTEIVLIVVSIIAAAVFTRLNRTLPAMDAPWVKRGQIKRIAESNTKIASALGFFAKILLGFICYVFIYHSLAQHAVMGCVPVYFSIVLKFILFFGFFYIIDRSYYLVSLDLSFAKFQSDILNQHANSLDKS